MTRLWWVTGFVMFLLGCSALGGGPEGAAHAEFEKWAKQQGIPYQNVQASATQNDGTFASVKVIAEFRVSPSSPWVEGEATTDCKKVGQEWQCNSDWRFNLSQRAVSATATVQAKSEQTRVAAETATAMVQAKSEQTRVAAETATAISLGVGKERIVNGVPMMIVPAGEFLMGSNDLDRQAQSDEKPQHTVYLDTFLIDKYEVTNAQYKKCVDVGRCSAPKENKSYSRNSYYGNSQYDNYPVINVSWNDAQAFCAWAGKRLATEAQWEKAARGNWQIYPWGNLFDKNLLNSSEGGTGDTTAVGSYPSGASPYGVMDMAGNVWEYVADWYDANYYKNSPSRNPTGPSSGQYRVLRGGSWMVSGVSSARTTTRYWYWFDRWYHQIGFRCAQ